MYKRDVHVAAFVEFARIAEFARVKAFARIARGIVAVPNGCPLHRARRLPNTAALSP